MEETSRTVLELFVTKAKELADMRFTQRILEQGGILQWRQGDDQPWRLGTQDEEIKSFILTLRMFIQQRDSISFRAVAKLLEDADLSSAWKNEFKRARTTVRSILQGQVPNLTVDGRPLTREDILQTFVYGDLAHAESAKRREFERWRRDPDFFAQAQFEFITLLVGILDQIFRVAGASRHELARTSSEA